MSTAHKTAEEKKEYFDSEEELERKVEILAEWVRESKHFIAFTGAGISTSAGIPDFRSGVNTVLPTGPGAWERLATGTTKQPDYRKKALSAIPTRSHMALVKLQQEGILKFLISQNTDGLHRKSGFNPKYLAELHGNGNLEICKGCNRQYFRDFRTRNALQVHDHRTDRRCENCGEILYDTIINFGEMLPQKALTDGFANAAKADLCLCLGSSLKVTPAADMPAETLRNGGKLVIVNLQPTPLDKYALRINGFIDNVMERLMAKLGLEIPDFILRRRIMVTKTEEEGFFGKKKEKLTLRGCDEQGYPYTLFTKIEAVLGDSKITYSTSKEPFIIEAKDAPLKGTAHFKFGFQGHYAEPPLNVDINLDDLEKNVTKYYLMEYDPRQAKWLNFHETSLV